MNYYIGMSSSQPQDDIQYVYEAPTDEELVTITWLDRIATRLGNPNNIDTQAGLKLMDAIIGVWEKHFPEEASAWLADRKVDLANEKALHKLTSIHSVGYNPVTYPPALFQLIKAMFPDMRLQEKKMWQKLIKIYPMFRSSNYA